MSEKFDTEPVSDPRGMAAIEIRHPEFAAGTAEPMVLLDDIFQVLGAAGFEGITMCNDPGTPRELPPVSWTSKLKSREWEAFHVCGFAVEA